jgi:hypothetical protein
LRRSETARDILAYLAAHPDAQDTLEGIVEWWLLEQRIRKQMAQVRESMAHLVAENLVLERRGKDSRTHYRINPRQMKKIRELLKQGGGAGIPGGGDDG